LYEINFSIIHIFLLHFFTHYLLDGSLMNGVLDDGLLRADDEVCRVDGLAEHVGGAAGVGAGVFSVNVQDVKRHEPKVKAFAESGS